MPQTISTTYARDNFADIISRAVYAGDDFLVEKWGRPVIKIIPAVVKKALPKKLTGLEFLQRLANYHAKGLPPDLAQNHDKYAWE